MEMDYSITELVPFIRVAHHYRFPVERNMSEAERIGYCYGFHLVDGGKGFVSAAGRTYPIKKGDLIYFPPELEHSFYSDPEEPLTTYNIYCDLWILLPQVTNLHLVWNREDFKGALLTLRKPCPELDRLAIVTPLQHHPAMIGLFAHAVHLHVRAGAYSEAISGALVKAFLMELTQTAHFNRPIDYRIRPIIDRIDKEANAGSRYEDWLEECGLRKTHFHELFRQATGLSPKAYWTRAIMKQAETALWESNRSVTAIAEDLGYSSIHHFTKQFTSFHGVSPSEFRRRKS
jgi:AraC family transcriptional activator of mtrCDE